MTDVASAPRRVALVTGGGTGIGAAITARFLADEYAVFVVQRTDDEAARARTDLEGRGGADVAVAAFDLATADGCIAAVQATVECFGRLDALVNNAGVSGAAAVRSLADSTDELVDRVIDTNLKAPLRLARQAAPHLAATEGVIVNIGSTAGSNAQANAAAYVASKAGLEGLTRALAYDLAPLGVRVVGVAPGDIASATSHDAAFVAERAAGGAVKHPPLGRSGTVDDVAAAVAWAASDQAGYVTGSTILVDGGLATF